MDPAPECRADSAGPPERAVPRVTPPEDSPSAEPDEPDVPVVSANAIPGAASAEPTPIATASAPKRPTKSEAEVFTPTFSRRLHGKLYESQG